MIALANQGHVALLTPPFQIAVHVFGERSEATTRYNCSHALIEGG
jgi:hypothetical protein